MFDDLKQTNMKKKKGNQEGDKHFFTSLKLSWDRDFMFNHWYALFFQDALDSAQCKALVCRDSVIHSVFTTVVRTFFLTVLFTSTSLSAFSRHQACTVSSVWFDLECESCRPVFEAADSAILVKITSTTNYTDYLWGEKCGTWMLQGVKV